MLNPNNTKPYDKIRHTSILLTLIYPPNNLYIIIIDPITYFKNIQ